MLNGSLTVPTASGQLYEIDTRLRPSGGDGLLCASVSSFAQYQRENAWTWEHMALTRARSVFGSAAARAEVDAIILDVLTSPRDTAKLHADVAKMRRDMAAHKPPKGELDVKLLPGGLVDLEFIIHALQLESGQALHPQLDKAIAALIAIGKLPAEMADAYSLLSKLLVLVRLVTPDCHVPSEPAQALIAKSLGYQSWAELLSAIKHFRDVVTGQWQLLLERRDF